MKKEKASMFERYNLNKMLEEIKKDEEKSVDVKKKLSQDEIKKMLVSKKQKETN